MSATNRKLKILFLHGYRQNEKLFRDRTGGIRKLLKNHVDFVYCEAPHDIPTPDPLETASTNTNEDSTETSPSSATEIGPKKAWWLKSSEFPDRSIEVDLKSTIDQMNKVFETSGPFDGVWGFSMGELCYN